MSSQSDVVKVGNLGMPTVYLENSLLIKNANTVNIKKIKMDNPGA